ncbi:MAG: aminotransferase class V-fold PLP-dependent enzyme [Gemmatimonadota bacterium]|nr:aminotransferase class V-fold PLP-dependent enzyme [Gemmatimonadota bacterium]
MPQKTRKQNKKSRKTNSKQTASSNGVHNQKAETLQELEEILKSVGPAAVDNEAYWQAVRNQFPYNGVHLYTNNGTIGILPHMVLQSQIETLKRAEIQSAEPPPVHYPGGGEARPKLAALINADPSEVAFTRNSTESMNIIAMGLDLNPGDEILTTTHEHSGGWTCWQNRQIQFGNPIRKVDLHDPPEDEDEIVNLFETAIRPETRVLSFCHITCTTAWRLPIKKLCKMARKHGLITVVDGAQSIGMVEVNVKDMGCDFFVSSTHKWLFAPKGSGMLYIDDAAENLIGLGYFTHGGRLTAGRFENHGSQSQAPMVGFAVAVDFHNAIGGSLIEDRGATMAEYLKSHLSDIPGVKLWTPMSRELSASMASFSIGGMSSSDVCNPLRERYKIQSRGLHEGGYHGARMSCAIHNTYEEMDKVIEAISEIAANRC